MIDIAEPILDEVITQGEAIYAIKAGATPAAVEAAYAGKGVGDLVNATGILRRDILALARRWGIRDDAP